MKLFPILILILLVPGCTAICPQPKQAVLQDQQRFIQAFDDFRTTNRVNELQQFIADFPDSDWTGRAETILLYSRELDQRKAQVEKIRQSQQQQTDDLQAQTDDLQAKAEELKQLKQENQQLTEKIDQLKGLLIELEQHPQ